MRVDDIQNMYRHDLGSFFHFAHHELNPHKIYQDNFHIGVMAHYLNMVISGKIRRLIINIPPRMLKSHCASVAFPAYVLGRDPRKKLLYLHNSRALGRDLQEQCAALMATRRYRALFPQNIIRPDGDRLLISLGGGRQYALMMARLTGLGADYIVIDDPISTDDAHNAHERARLNRQFDENILQRLNDKKSGAIILITQRLGEDDLTAHLLAKEEGWVHVSMPAIALEDELWNLSHGRTHKRCKGEALHPARESAEDLIGILESIGGHAFAYQYLQGQYKPRFDETGRGGIWLPDIGFVTLNESDLILPRVFGIGDDPCPDGMRTRLTEEEFQKKYGSLRHDPETGRHYYSDDPDREY